MRPLRGALVGLGAIARAGHLPRWRLRADATIVAAAEATWRGRPGEVDPTTGLPTYAALADLLDDRAADFVDVATPPSSHAELAALALRRGLHVFCEKPLVVTRPDLERLREAVRGSDRVLFTVHNWRHAPILAAASRAVAAGAVGRPRTVAWEVERTGPSATVEATGNWRLDPAVAGGGILVDHGWHALYVVLGWMGGVPARVEARLERRRYVDLAVEDTARTRLAWADGAEATLDFTWAGERRRNAAHVEGTDGRIDLLDDRLVLTRGSGPEERTFPAALSAGSSHPDWFDATVDDFLAEVRGDVARGTNLAMARDVFRVLEAAWSSDAAGGAPVPVGA